MHQLQHGPPTQPPRRHVHHTEQQPNHCPAHYQKDRSWAKMLWQHQACHPRPAGQTGWGGAGSYVVGHGTQLDPTQLRPSQQWLLLSGTWQTLLKPTETQLLWRTPAFAWSTVDRPDHREREGHERIYTRGLCGERLTVGLAAAPVLAIFPTAALAAPRVPQLPLPRP